MQFLSIAVENQGVFKFAISEVRAYHIIYRQKVRKDPAHCVVLVTMKPTKAMDAHSFSEVVDHCIEYEWRYETYDDAQRAIRIEDSCYEVTP